MTADRWQYLKALRPTRRLVWDSGKRGTFCENNNARKQATRENRERSK